MESKISGPPDIEVICIKVPIFNHHHYQSPYVVDKKYKARYLYDKCLISDNDYIEYEWQVFCAKYNHYQFTQVEFDRHFVDIRKQRDEKIDSILNI